MPTEAGLALLNTFEQIRIINLNSRADRRREISGEFGRLGLAVDGKHIAFHNAFRPSNAGPFTSIGAHGCFISHLNVLQDALTAGVGSILIVEDDLDFTLQAEDLIPSTLQDLRMTSWSIFYGGYENFPNAHSDTRLSRVSSEHSIQTTHCVGFKRKAAEAAVPYLLQMLTRPPGHPSGGPMHIDGAYSWLRRANPHLETYLAASKFGSQRPSRTDVQELSWLDRVSAIQGMMAAGRRFKRYFVRSTRN